MSTVEFLSNLDYPKGLLLEEKQAGVTQMLDDLKQLAEKDGCIAAGYALEVLNHLAEKEKG